MTGRYAWNSNLAAPTKPIARHTRLRNRGGSMYYLSADDRAMWNWLGELTKGERLPCDGCGVHRYLFRCHLLPRSRGGRVIDNVALLDVWCHEQQEKKTEQFNAANGVDLYAKARERTNQWRRELTE